MNTLNNLSAATLAATLIVLGAEAAQAQALNPVRPILESVISCPTGPYIAYFGYKNENPGTVVIPVGEDNKFTPAPQNRGQTTSFLSGRVTNAFSVPFSGGNLVWTLRTPQGARRTATASSTKATPVDVCPANIN